MAPAPPPSLLMLLVAELAANAMGCSHPVPWSAPGQHALWLTVDGIRRQFFVWIPHNYNKDGNLPVVLSLPGSGTDAKSFMSFPDMIAYAERAPFYTVVMSGLNNNFNVGFNSQPEPGQPDDIGYVKAVLSWLNQNLCIDRSRIFCVGISRGARFCCRLASELPGVFAAIAPISGLRYPLPNRALPTPVVAIHGTADLTNPYKGGGPYYWGSDSVPLDAEKWALWNGCTQRIDKTVNQFVQLALFTSCNKGADVQLYSISGAPHSGVGADGAPLFPPWRPWMDPMSLMWDFFAAHPLSQGHTLIFS